MMHHRADRVPVRAEGSVAAESQTADAVNGPVQCAGHPLLEVARG